MPITEVAIVVLVDQRGRVLMQHRDSAAPVEPGRWTPPGGRLEPGEDAATAAHRELLEETGLTAALEPVGVLDRARAAGELVRFHVFAGVTGATQEDVVLGEGDAMLFLTRDEIARLELTTNAAALLDLTTA